MNPLIEMERDIRGFIELDLPSRPFLCDGSPIGCEVALVGINPGTDVPFWDFWSSTTGVDKNKWLSEFKKKHSMPRKPTRRRIELFLDALRPWRCLELNVYPYATPSAAELTKAMKDVRVFEYMINRIRPRMIIALGDPAIRAVAKLHGKPLIKGQVLNTCIADVKCQLLADEHFRTGRWTDNKAKEFGRFVRDVLRQGESTPAGNGSSVP